MRKFILYAAFVAAAVLIAVGLQQVNAADLARCAEHLPYGEPKLVAGGGAEICHPGYFSLYDVGAKVPRVVAYRLTGEHTLGCLGRLSNFHKDAQAATAVQDDYAASGYDLGHFMNSEDGSWDKAILYDTYSMANIAPQLPGLNRQGWERLEETARAWAWSRGELLIYIGPVLGPADLKIGDDQVDVPIAFWKVLVDIGSGEAIAFEMPQQNIAKGNVSDPAWRRSIAEIELQAGVQLPLPPAIDRAAKPATWLADLPSWRAEHNKRCHAPKG